MYVERIRIPNPTYPSVANLEQRERGADTERAVTLDGDTKRDKREQQQEDNQSKKEEQVAVPLPDEALKSQTVVDIIA
jgi:hypothetical protein